MSTGQWKVNKGGTWTFIHSEKIIEFKEEKITEEVKQLSVILGNNCSVVSSEDLIEMVPVSHNALDEVTNT